MLDIPPTTGDRLNEIQHFLTALSALAQRAGEHDKAVGSAITQMVWEIEDRLKLIDPSGAA